MQKKVYRVVCWEPEKVTAGNDINVDIAPVYNSIHAAVFYSRMRQYRLTHPNEKIRDVGHSVYLTVFNDKNPDIKFAEHTPESREKLIPLILQTYQKMREQGRESTLDYVMSIPEVERYKEEINAEAVRTEDRNEAGIASGISAADDKYAENAREEQLLQQEQQWNEAQKRKQSAIDYRAALDAKVDPIARMLAKMRQYDGD